VTKNATDWVWQHSRAVNAGRIVLLAVAHEANRDGEAEMSITELAAKCRLGERTVQTAVKELTACGELQARHGGGRGHRTQYRVIMRNPADPAPFEPSNPADPAPFRETPQILHPAESAPFRGHRRRPERNPAESAPQIFTDVLSSSTGRSEVLVKDTSANSDPPALRADVGRLCEHLADRIEANGSKRPVIGKRWHDAARLMLDLDGRSEERIHRAIDWCQDDEFWRSNILSMPKLRQQYEQLRLQAARPANNGRKTSTTDERVRAGLELAERFRQAEQATTPKTRELPA